MEWLQELIPLVSNTRSFKFNVFPVCFNTLNTILTGVIFGSVLEESTTIFSRYKNGKCRLMDNNIPSMSR